MTKSLPVCLLAVVLVSALAQAEPGLEIQPTEFDFGQVGQNRTVVYNAWFRSCGGDTLVIGTVKTGCGCLSAPLASPEIPPGDSARVTFFWQIRGAAGEQTQTAYVYTNSAEGPQKLTFRAVAVELPDTTLEVFCRPEGLIFESPHKTDKLTKTFHLVNNSKTDLVVQLIATSEKGYELELPETVPAGGFATGTVRIDAEYTKDPWEGSFTLELGSPSTEMYRLTVSVACGDFSYRPIFTTTK